MIREVVRVNKSTFMALVETHISGETAPKICDRITFSGQFRVEAQGFSCGIWLFWKKELISVRILNAYTQHITIEILKNGVEPWIFTALYAILDSTLRRQLWEALEDAKRRYPGP